MAGSGRPGSEGWRISRELELPWAAPRSVAMLGMGGSAIGGDLVKGHLGRPPQRARGGRCAATSCRPGSAPTRWSSPAPRAATPRRRCAQLEAALARRCPVVCVSTGGALRRVAEAASLPLLTFPGRGSPRASRGLVDGHRGRHPRASRRARARRGRDRGGRGRRRHEAVARCGPDVPTADNPAKQLAWSLVDRFVIDQRRRASWRRWRAAGRRSSTRTARPRPSSRSCPRPRTTRSSASSSPSRCAITSPSSCCGASWSTRANALRASSSATSWRPGTSGTPRVETSGRGSAGPGPQRHRHGRLRQRLHGLHVRGRPDADRRSSITSRSSWRWPIRPAPSRPSAPVASWWSR